MGQKVRQDKIGALSHSAGTISMAATSPVPAYLTVGGQQYKIVSDLTLSVGTATANTLYMIYATVSAGVVSLQKSTAVNSVGPGTDSWKLVGAFYSSAANTWGSFVTIEGTPESDWVTWTPTGSWTTNTTYTGKYRRLGQSLEIQYRLAVTGAPTSAGLTFDLPSGFTLDTTNILDTTASRQQLGWVNLLDSGSATYQGAAMYNTSTTIAANYIDDAGGPAIIRGNITQAAPMTFANGDTVNANVLIPIVGWSSASSLKDL